MPLDKHNLIMAKTMGLIFFLLFDVASAREVPFWHTAVHMMHSSWNYHAVSFFVFYSSLLSQKVNLEVGNVVYVTEIIHIFHSGYFDYRDNQF